MIKSDRVVCRGDSPYDPLLKKELEKETVVYYIHILYVHIINFKKLHNVQYNCITPIH